LIKTHIETIQEKIQRDSVKETRKLAKSKEQQIEHLDFFKNSFWGTPIPIGKITRILERKNQSKTIDPSLFDQTKRAQGRNQRPLSSLPSPNAGKRRCSLIIETEQF
jgi:hypothetical protein